MFLRVVAATSWSLCMMNELGKVSHHVAEVSELGSYRLDEASPFPHGHIADSNAKVEGSGTNIYLARKRPTW